MPESDQHPSRRGLLSVGAASVAGLASAGAVAGCTTRSSTGSDTPTTSTEAAPPTGSSSAAATAVAKLSDVPVGGAVVKEVNGNSVVISRTGDTTVVGLDARCPHQSCAVNVKDSTLVCPCHGSRFNIATGAVEQGPATSALQPVALTVVGEEIVAS